MGELIGFEMTEEEWLGIEKQMDAGIEKQMDPGAEPDKLIYPSIVKLSDVEPEEVEFLWDPYIPLRKITLMEGDPGLGKTFMSLAICAAISVGGGLPDQNGRCTQMLPPGRVLFMTAEDGIADTLAPRLDKMQANRENIYCLTGWRAAESEDEKSFCLSDVDVLRAALEEVKPILVVIDPLQAYLGGGVDMHRANETRPILSNLGKIAEEYDCAILAIRHLSKTGGNKAIYRGLGSIDFTAAARSVLMVGMEQNTQQKAVAHIKSSCTMTGVSLGFEINNDFGLAWTGISNFSVEELLAAGPDAVDREDRGDSQLGEAIDFLHEILQDGPLESKEIRKQAKAASIGWRTVERAKEQLDFKAFKKEEKWYWPRLRPDSTPSHISAGGVGGDGLRLTESGVAGTPPRPPINIPDGLDVVELWADLGEIKEDVL